MKISIYHAHEVDKTIKKHDNDLYTARPRKSYSEATPPKWAFFVYRMEKAWRKGVVKKRCKNSVAKKTL